MIVHTCTSFDIKARVVSSRTNCTERLSLHDPREALPAGLIRRLAALVYDSLLIAALLMLVTLIFVAVRGGDPVEPGNPIFQLALIVTVGGFFTGFWVRGGQTLGMRAWRLKVEQKSGDALTWKVAVIRFLAGIVSVLPFGAGMIWSLFDPEGLTVHDRIAGTRVRLLPKSR